MAGILADLPPAHQLKVSGTSESCSEKLPLLCLKTGQLAFSSPTVPFVFDSVWNDLSATRENTDGGDGLSLTYSGSRVQRSDC